MLVWYVDCYITHRLLFTVSTEWTERHNGELSEKLRTQWENWAKEGKIGRIWFPPSDFSELLSLFSCEQLCVDRHEQEGRSYSTLEIYDSVRQLEEASEGIAPTRFNFLNFWRLLVPFVLILFGWTHSRARSMLEARVRRDEIVKSKVELASSSRFHLT